MKRIFVSLFLIIPLISNSQFNYQSLLRDSNGTLITNTTVNYKISFIYDSSSGTPIYSEVHSITAPSDGVFNIVIGEGSVTSGAFNQIDWSRTIYIKREVDTTGSGSYTDFGTTLLNSVPKSNYSLSTQGLTYSSLASTVSITNLNISNTVTATAFVGDGSGLTNLGAGNIGGLNIEMSGNLNVAIGKDSFTNNTTGSGNTSIGYNALMSNTVGEGNTAIGYNALSVNTSGFINVSVGMNTLEENTTGTGNTAVGYRSGQYNTTGGNNTFLGNHAKTTSGSTITNATAIGANAEVSVSNKIRLGDTNVSVIEGQVGFTAASDRRLKEQISKTKYGLETLLKLVPVDYLLKSNGLAQIGFIAQDLKPLVPEAVNGTEGDIEKGETLGITYTTLIPILTKAIQEQQSQIDSQAKQIKILLQRIEVLEKK
jgi:hypothetical protein